VPATYCMFVVCCFTIVVILCCGVTACWDLSSEYRSCWFFDLPIKREKAEQVVRGIPLGLFIHGLGCSNLMLCIYADHRGECYFCAIAVLSAYIKHAIQKLNNICVCLKMTQEKG
jgi:hypothetical protein